MIIMMLLHTKFDGGHEFLSLYKRKPGLKKTVTSGECTEQCSCKAQERVGRFQCWGPSPNHGPLGKSINYTVMRKKIKNKVFRVTVPGPTNFGEPTVNFLCATTVRVQTHPE